MINLHAKFEVSVFSHYEDMKGNAKCRNCDSLGIRGHPRTVAMSPFDRAHFIFNFNRNYASIMYHFRVIASCQKSPILTYPFAFGGPIG